MHVLRRSETMPESPIRKLVPYADEAKKRGIKIYHLNIGQPDIKTPECALEAIRKVDRKILEYSPSQGYLGLRKRMAEYYRKFNVKVSEDEIIVTTGGSEAISMTLNTCLDNGDEMIVTEPSYANYISLAAQNGVAIRAVKTHIEDGFKLPPVERFEDLITERTKAILLCNPNNPTGYVYSTEEMNILRDMAKKHDLFLIVDEVYREFTYTGVPYFSSLRLKGVDENVIVIDSVSKRFSECGIRIGAIVTRNKDVRAGIMKQCQARLSPPLLGQIAAEASYDAPREYMQDVYDEYIARRDFLIEGLNKIPGVFTPMPMGAFYTMVRLPVDNAEKFCKWCLTDFSYKGATVMMAPGSGFYSDHTIGNDEVRMAYVLRREDLARALTVLAKALEAYNRR